MPADFGGEHCAVQTREAGRRSVFNQAAEENFSLNWQRKKFPPPPAPFLKSAVMRFVRAVSFLQPWRENIIIFRVGPEGGLRRSFKQPPPPSASLTFQSQSTLPPAPHHLLSSKPTTCIRRFSPANSTCLFRKVLIQLPKESFSPDSTWRNGLKMKDSREEVSIVSPQKRKKNLNRVIKPITVINCKYRNYGEISDQIQRARGIFAM